MLARKKRNTDIFGDSRCKWNSAAQKGTHVFLRKIAPFVCMRGCIFHPIFATILHASEKSFQPKTKSSRIFVDVVKKVGCIFRIPKLISTQKSAKVKKLRILRVYNTLLAQSPKVLTFRSDLKQRPKNVFTFRPKVSTFFWLLTFLGLFV